MTSERFEVARARSRTTPASGVAGRGCPTCPHRCAPAGHRIAQIGQGAAAVLWGQAPWQTDQRRSGQGVAAAQLRGRHHEQLRLRYGYPAIWHEGLPALTLRCRAK